MITLYQNFEIVVSVTFYLLAKFLCYFYVYLTPMHGRKPTLCSIPEKNEYDYEEEFSSKVNGQNGKWVPKKKHDVLKAKYKCLKKLFQIYDASVIGILPEPNEEIYPIEDTSPRRKRRSHRTKTDACACTSETSQCAVTDPQPIAKSVIKDLNIQCSCSTQMFSDGTSVPEKALNQDSKDTFCQCACARPEYAQTTEPHQLPYPRKKLTRFQSFIQRIFGLRPEKHRNNLFPEGHVYAASDDNIMHHYYGNRRRKRLRFRSHRRPKKVHSELSLRDLKSPSLLTYVQSVQKHYLMDTTPRQCPLSGCRMMTYGLINYNDHLNLCHFPERKNVCHYCHEGFELPSEKTSHENEHIGLSKLNFTCTPSTGHLEKKPGKTQTEPAVSEEKLKKIVSFFDRMVDGHDNDIKSNTSRYSESNLQSSKTVVTTADTDDSMSNVSSGKRTVSCGNLMHRKTHKGESIASNSEMTHCCNLPVKCHFCGEVFGYRRQLSLHVDLEHRIHDKFSKFHSCAGITNPCLTRYCESRKDFCPEGSHCIEKKDATRSDRSLQDKEKSPVKKKSEETLNSDPSTNIIFYETLEREDKYKDLPEVDSHHSQSRQNQHNLTRYKWEPGTKIIRV